MQGRFLLKRLDNAVLAFSCETALRNNPAKVADLWGRGSAASMSKTTVTFPDAADCQQTFIWTL
jgi:hypothetical protein